MKLANRVRLLSAVVALLWAGLASYLHAKRAEHVIGCGSIPLADDPRRAGGVCRRLVRDHLAAEEWRVTPRVRFPWAEEEPAPPDAIPPLIRGYLRLGASVCGEPAWDADFGTADLRHAFVLDPVQPLAPFRDESNEVPARSQDVERTIDFPWQS